MSDERPVSPMLARLLEEERRQVEPGVDAVRERVMARVRASLDDGGPDDGGPDDGGAGGGGPGGSGGAPASDVSAAPSVPAPGASADTTAGLWTAPKVALVAAVSLSLGAVGGWGVRGALEPAPTDDAPTRVAANAAAAPEPALPEPAPAEPAPAEESGAAPAETESPRDQAPPRLRRRQPPRVPEPEATPPAEETPPEPAGPRSRERALIDRARAALQRGDAHEAMVSLMQHERLYPDGVFAQERDRLAIEGLRAAGRHAQAERRTRAFLQAYPDSPHAPLLRERLGASNQ